MSSEINFKFIRPFGPAICKVTMPKQIIDNLNNYVDQKVDTKVWSIKVKNYPSYKNLWKSLEEYESTLFPKFIEGITYLIKSLPNENFVIRPHPIENEQIYINLFKDFPKVSVNESPIIPSDKTNVSKAPVSKEP